MVGLGPTIHEFLLARPRCCRQTRGWSCQARPWRMGVRHADQRLLHCHPGLEPGSIRPPHVLL